MLLKYEFNKLVRYGAVCTGQVQPEYSEIFFPHIEIEVVLLPFNLL